MLLISKVHISTFARLGALGAALFGGTAVGGFQSREAASPTIADAHVHLSLGLTLCAAATPDGSFTARRQQSKDRKGCCRPPGTLRRIDYGFADGSCTGH